jgi:CRP/FNR family transcriptional regulator, nitrogen oxide reductase regulator
MKTETDARPTMTTAEIAARIDELAPRFLAGLTPSDLAAVLGAATPRRFHARTVIAREEHDAERAFLFLEGRGRTYTMTDKGEKVLLLWIFPGDPAGGRALLSEPMKYMVNTETVTDSTVLVWPRSSLMAVTRQYPRLLENALMIASDYLESYRDLHVAASYDTAGKRVARALDRLVKDVGQRIEDGVEFNISNEDLANEANVTIFTVSRLLSEWRRKGLLVKSRGRVVVRSPEQLINSVC